MCGVGRLLARPRIGAQFSEPGSKGVPQGRYMLDHVRKVRWAFIAWEPVSAPSS